MDRPSREQVFMQMASAIARRSTCSRRAVGCVLTDRRGRILSAGHNGVPRQHAHCTSEPCAGSGAASGTALDQCLAIHAEQNALMFCKDIDDIYAAFVTTSPCMTCVKMLLNTRCQYIVYSEEYPHAEAFGLWKKARRQILQIDGGTPVSWAT